MAKIISESDDNLLISMTRPELALYCQSIMESFERNYENDSISNAVLLAILIPLGPVIKYALPNTQELYNVWLAELNSPDDEPTELELVQEDESTGA